MSADPSQSSDPAPPQDSEGPVPLFDGVFEGDETVQISSGGQTAAANLTDDESAPTITALAIDPANFLQTAFGKDRGGRPYGGGRADKGGFQIPLGMLAECEDSEALWRISQQVVRSSLAKVLPDIAK